MSRRARNIANRVLTNLKASGEEGRLRTWYDDAVDAIESAVEETGEPYTEMISRSDANKMKRDLDRAWRRYQQGRDPGGDAFTQTIEDIVDEIEDIVDEIEA